MTITELINTFSIPAGYGVFQERQKPPFVLYLGAGQGHFIADNMIYAKQEQYQLEYYFTKKKAALENEIESKLISDGWLYEKSEDVYIEDQKLFVIYYTVWRQ